MSLPQVTVAGRLTADPELRFTPSGKAVANFTIAASERRKNTSTEEWEDGDKCFLRCSVWEQQGENVSESLVRGCEVVATGRLYQREYTTKEGEKRTSVELKIDQIAAAVTRTAQVRITKLEHAGALPVADPWAQSVPAGSITDDPPF